jgi:hypothetical protein
MATERPQPNVEDRQREVEQACHERIINLALDLALDDEQEALWLGVARLARDHIPLEEKIGYTEEHIWESFTTKRNEAIARMLARSKARKPKTITASANSDSAE